MMTTCFGARSASSSRQPATTCSTRATGEAGLRLQREQGADLVLVDIFMPKRDGLGVIQALRASDAQPKIVAMSGGGHTGQQEVLKSAAAVGASRTLRKPFQPRELLTAIREVLNESRP